MCGLFEEDCREKLKYNVINLILVVEKKRPFKLLFLKKNLVNGINKEKLSERGEREETFLKKHFFMLPILKIFLCNIHIIIAGIPLCLLFEGINHNLLSA